MRRRDFVLLSGGSLLLAGGVSRATLVAAAASDAAAVSEAAQLPFAMLEILPNNEIVVRVAKSEMGQGVLTALPMLIAEELHVALTDIRAELAPGAAAFRDSRGGQITGGSSSVSSSYRALRTLGAAAREMLLTAAAEVLAAPTSQLAVRGPTIVDARSGRSVTFASLLSIAAALPVPQSPALTANNLFRLIGKPLPKLDSSNKVDGSARFGIDVRLPNMRVALLARAPTFGGMPKEVTSAAALAVPGVERVVTLSTGVAVIARDFWAAKRGRAALQVKWERGVNGNRSSATHAVELDAALTSPGRSARSDGVIAGDLAGDQVVSADYRTPFLAHAALEPLAATAHVQADRCDVWLGTQSPSRVQQWGAKLTGLPEARIFVHTHTIGGAFGRRGEWDFYLEAIELSKLTAAPIKLMWTREDDMGHDFYRPASVSRLAAQLGAQGRPVQFTARVAAPSINRRRNPAGLEKDIDRSLVEGLFNHLYAIPNQRIDYQEVELGVPVGFWRSVGHSNNVFFVESFIDELAHHAAADPLDYRLALLAQEPRLQGVLRRAAEVSRWGHLTAVQRAAGRGQGIACAKSYGTYVAEVVDVDFTGGELKIERVTCAVDCGQAVNPNIIEQQMHSGIVYGLTAALRGSITIEMGAVRESNFHDYRLLAIHEVPPIDVHLIASGASPGGCGEPATPVIAPALANAIFAATGRRLRALPLEPQLRLT
ncbi:MAG: xanthine dehydrogenase family protein molybdopterin-binding subunit [Proteobacteria bacterium]|nr:xanthine dehydrogenase family protein molybdopterin-binding subunit [Pseudomonadota bacterium]